MISSVSSDSSALLGSQADRARAFHALHDDGVLVLPNAWDVASAVLIRDAGAHAVATTSAGASWSLGAPDGEQLNRDRAVDLIARICGLLDEPVTADIEAGYGSDPEQVATTAHAVLAAGAVGVNVEDSGGDPLRHPLEQAERIRAVRAAADAAGVPLFINARTDTFLLQVGEPGADGIFVPGLVDAGLIRQLTGAVIAPVNIMAGPGAPTVEQLADLGVRRVSVGMALAQVAYAHTVRVAAELLTEGTYASLAGGLDYQTMNSALSTAGSGRRPAQP